MRSPWKRLAIIASVLTMVVALAVGLYATVMAAEPTPELAASPTPTPGPKFETMNDRLERAGELVPGFGGLFLDPADNSIVYVYMLDTTQQAAAEQAARRVLGAERFTREVEVREVRILQGKYSTTQLAEWYQQLGTFLWNIPGVTGSDLEEGANRLWVGVRDAQTRQAVEEGLLRAAIPLEAVAIELRQPIQFASHTLSSRFRSPEGGVQGGIEIIAPGKLPCSFGFNANRDGVLGMITASHCSPTMWGLDYADFYQPTVAAGNHIGVEAVDPGPFTGGNCPVGWECRYSDATFVDLDDADVPATLGRIAKTQGLGSVQVDHQDPFFRVFDIGSVPVSGEWVDKMGKTTGWSWGEVTRTCYDAPTPPNKLVKCQEEVRATVDGGDSGGPVFQVWYSPHDIKIKGILWGMAPPYYYFSYVGNVIWLDLGPSSTWQVCDPAFGC